MINRLPLSPKPHETPQPNPVGRSNVTRQEFSANVNKAHVDVSDFTPAATDALVPLSRSGTPATAEKRAGRGGNRCEAPPQTGNLVPVTSAPSLDKPSGKGFFENAWGAISNGVSSIAGAVASGVSSIAGAVASGVSSVAGAVASGASSVAGAIATGVSSVAGAVATGVSSVAGAVATGVSSFASSVASGISSVAGAVASGVSTVAGAISSGVQVIGTHAAAAAQSLWSGVADGVSGIAQNVWNGVLGLGSGLANLFQGGLGDIGSSLLTLFLKTPFDATFSILGGCLSAVQSLFGLESPPQQLLGEEIDSLQPIFGDSVDYSQVHVNDDNPGIFGLFNGSNPFVLGNTIYMPETASSLQESMAQLIQGITHIWQHQNGGASHVGASIWANTFGQGNDWQAGFDQGLGWSELNPQQQAALLVTAFLAGCITMAAGERFIHKGKDYTQQLQAALAQVKAGIGAR